MQVPIETIKVSERVRKDMGDLGALVASMEKYGQLSPIVVTRTHELVAGHRRLQSAQQLGWHTIAVTYVDQTSEDAKLEMELQENVHRKDFSPEELLDGYRRLDKLRRPGLGRRIAMFFHRLFERLFRRKRRKEEEAPTVTVSAPEPIPDAEADEAADEQYGV